MAKESILSHVTGDVIKLRILKVVAHPILSGLALNAITHNLKRGRQRESQHHAQRKKAMWRQRKRSEWCSHRQGTQRNVNSCQTLDETRKARGRWPCPTDTLSSYFWPPELWKNKVLLFKLPVLCQFTIVALRNWYTFVQTYEIITFSHRTPVIDSLNLKFWGIHSGHNTWDEFMNDWSTVASLRKFRSLGLSLGYWYPQNGQELKAMPHASLWSFHQKGHPDMFAAFYPYRLFILFYTYEMYSDLANISNYTRSHRCAISAS